MTAPDLLSLIRSWRDGDCPGEVLCDAISEYGIDADVRDGYTVASIRDHLEAHRRDSGNEDVRIRCKAIQWVEQQLKDNSEWQN